MQHHLTNEEQSMKAIQALTTVYRRVPGSQQITQDIGHIIVTYKLRDREAAIACNRYIIIKYPEIYKVAPRYGLHRMSENEIHERSISELSHMLHALCLFLYDKLKSMANEKQTIEQQS